MAADEHLRSVFVVPARRHPLLDVSDHVVDAVARNAARARTAVVALPQPIELATRRFGGAKEQDLGAECAPRSSGVADFAIGGPSVSVRHVLRPFARRLPFVFSAKALALARAPRGRLRRRDHDDWFCAAAVRRLEFVHAGADVGRRPFEPRDAARERSAISPFDLRARVDDLFRMIALDEPRSRGTRRGRADGRRSEDRQSQEGHQNQRHVHAEHYKRSIARSLESARATRDSTVV